MVVHRGEIHAERKKGEGVRRASVQDLGEALQSGEAGETGENPQTLADVLEHLKHGISDSASNSELLADILGALQSQNPLNWKSVRDELVTIVKEVIGK